MTELQTLNNSVTYTSGIVEFKSYEKLKTDALRLAEDLKNTKVDETNVKESKKLIADVNKRVKFLNDRRIEIKKEVMKPYLQFENQVKEIQSIVDDANETVKSQVRELEEIERENKYQEIIKLWDLNVHEEDKHLRFADFFKDQYLNKSFSMNKVENELQEFIVQVERDVTYLKRKENYEVLLQKYFETYDITEVLEYEEKIKRVVEQFKDFEDEEIFEIEEEIEAAFLIKGKANIKLVEMLLQENEIKYIKG